MTTPADLLIVGRIATLRGRVGLGVVEAIGVRGGRVVAAGRRADIEGLGGPATRRLDLAPDEIAIPGLTDAHLHLAEAAMAAERVDLSGAATYEEALGAIAEMHRSLADGDGWIQALGWDADRWGRWPEGADLERVAPGRKVAAWAHDHHAYLASPAALLAAGVTEDSADPPGGVIRRDDAGRPTGVLHESAARLVSAHVPAPTVGQLADAIERLGQRLVAIGLTAVHDPGGVAPDPDLAGGMAAYRQLADGGRLPLRVHASLREEALDTAIERGHRSGMPLGPEEGRARIGWLKLFSDGSLGSRTAMLLAPYELEPGRPAPPGGSFGVWLTEPDRLAELVARAADAGIASQVHAIGDAAARAALAALEPSVRRVPLMPRLEHVQLLDPVDLPRFAAAGVAASIQPIHLRSDAAAARRAWGLRAEAHGYPWRSLAASGAVVAFGTDAPVEPWDPWPGLEIAVTRRWDGDSGSAPFGSREALDIARALRAQCLDAARSAGEQDRGRLTPGCRADLVVIDAAALDEPVVPGGPLGETRPRRVLLDGAVVAEA